MKRTLFLLFTCILLLACGDIKRVDRSGMEAEEADREVKVVKDGEIISLAETLGKGLASRDFRNLSDRKILVDSLSKQGIVLEYLQISDTTKAVSEEQLSLLQAYAYNLQNGLPLESNLQIIKKENILYTYPKMKNDSLEAIVSILFTRKGLVKRL